MAGVELKLFGYNCLPGSQYTGRDFHLLTHSQRILNIHSKYRPLFCQRMQINDPDLSPPHPTVGRVSRDFFLENECSRINRCANADECEYPKCTKNSKSLIYTENKQQTNKRKSDKKIQPVPNSFISTWSKLTSINILPPRPVSNTEVTVSY